jgi:hypothetical protein
MIAFDRRSAHQMPTLTPLPPPAAPPAGVPAVLQTIDPGTEAPGPRSPSAAVEGGRLVVRAAAPGSVAGYPFAPDSYRDVVVDAVLSLDRGDAGDAYGVFVRQHAERSYVAFVVTPVGRCAVVMLSEGLTTTLAEGPLPPDAPFAAGTGAANRLTVVAAGPCLTCIVNGFVVTGVIVDPRFKAGLAGAIMIRSEASPEEAQLSLQWAQVRALLVDQA